MLPAPIALAATFSPELARRYGQALGRNSLLALTANIARAPQSGRSFETLGEDPLLAAAILTEEVRGIQSTGRIAAVKHFAVSAFEQDGRGEDVLVDERTLRELSLPAFQAAVKAGAGMVITTPHRLNGITAAENPLLIDTILRKEWGFTGFVGKAPPVSVAEEVKISSAKIAREVTIAGSVLLKNKNDLLPLRKSDLQNIAVIGGKSADDVRTSLARRNSGKAPLFAAGDGLALTRAVALAKKARTVIVFASDEGAAGKDRVALSLPGEQDALIAAVVAANPRTVVVLSTGSCVTMPWLARAAAVLETWYPGSEGAEAIAAMLTGEAEPGGRLPITFPKRLADSPTASAARFPGVNGKLHYSEGIFAGYRHYDKQKIAPLFPFGHGLGYTRFQLSSLNVSHGQLRFVVTNIGPRIGSAIPQVYVGPVSNPPVPLEEKKLVAFTRITLKPGESRVLNLTIPEEALAYWSPAERQWVTPVEPRPVYVGFSSRDSQISASMDG